MGGFRKIRKVLFSFRWLGVLLAVTFLAGLLWRLRSFPDPADPLFFGYLEILGGVIALACAAAALVRFRGTRDHVSLIVALGFLLAGSIETGFTPSFFAMAAAGLGRIPRLPLAWTLSQTLLAALLVAALVVEKRLPFARRPNREIVFTLLTGAVLAYVATYVILYGVPLIRSSGPSPRPWQLLPAAIYLLAAIGYGRRFSRADSAFDHAICYAAVMNLSGHLAASQSANLFGPLFIFAEIAKVSSYAVVLGGALVDSGRLFEQVRQMAASDPLTGLPNYRRLLDALDTEIKRCQRNRRSFVVLLLDLDELKAINDRYGHLVGSKALVRLANVLRVHCRETDIPARYGGDEFALVLPETGEEAARQVAERIRQRLAGDGEFPVLSASVGLAIYPRDGATVEKLLGAADYDLYGMKAGGELKILQAGGLSR